MPRFTRLTLPSHYQGYARSAGESAYPNLWGMAGAWAPGIGNTGFVLRDLSGHNNHGTLDSSMTSSDWVIANHEIIRGYALDFDGIDDHVSLPISPSLTQTAPAVSMIAWIKGDGGNNNVSVICCDDGSTDDYRLEIKDNGSSRRIIGQFNTTGGSGTEIWVLGTTPSWVIWQQYAVTWNNGTVETYLNGMLVQSGTVGSGTLAYPGVNNIDLMRNSSSSQHFGGQLGVAYIYFRALNPSEIWRLYTNPLAPFELRRRVFGAPPAAPAGGRIMSSLVGAGGLAGMGGIAGQGGGLAA